MHLLIESGKTKIDGVLIVNGSVIHEIHGPGIDLDKATEQSLLEYFQMIFKEIHHDDIETVKRYTAGSNHWFVKLENSLKIAFPSAHVTVENDVVGAGIACFGQEEGIVCILGTGSNSAHVRQGKIIQQRGGLGQLVGDEGSGYMLGKRLIHGYLMELFPEETHQKIQEIVGNRAASMKELYSAENQIMKIASYSQLYTELQDEYLNQIAHEEFDRFFQNTIVQYPNFATHRLGVIGSIGRHFQEKIREVANQYGIRDIEFVQYPLQGLIKHASLT